MSENSEIQKTISIDSIYPTYGDVISDPVFQKAFRRRYNDIINSRKSRPEPPAGKKYRRDWYDSMKNSGMLNFELWLENIILIWAKQSNLSANTRNVIHHTAGLAFNDAIQHHLLEMSKQAETEKPAESKEQSNQIKP